MTLFDIGGSKRRLVVKVGSSLLFDKNNEALRTSWILTFIDDIVSIRSRGTDIVVVTSGTVAIGRSSFIYDHGCRTEYCRQAAASLGQLKLAQIYSAGFARKGALAGQLLISPRDLNEPERCRMLQGMLGELFKNQAVPIVNENDAVASSFETFGNNDIIAAAIAEIIGADALIILTDVDGLYTTDPRIDPSAQLITEITEFDSSIVCDTSELEPGRLGSGGMASKLKAARLAQKIGCSTIITSGEAEHPLKDLDNKSRATRIKSSVCNDAREFVETASSFI